MPPAVPVVQPPVAVTFETTTSVPYARSTRHFTASPPPTSTVSLGVAPRPRIRRGTGSSAAPTLRWLPVSIFTPETSYRPGSTSIVTSSKFPSARVRAFVSESTSPTPSFACARKTAVTAFWHSKQPMSTRSNITRGSPFRSTGPSETTTASFVEPASHAGERTPNV